MLKNKTLNYRLSFIFERICLILFLLSAPTSLSAEVNHVTVTSGDYTMKADEMLPFDPRNNQMVFSGNVILYTSNMQITGSKMEIYKTTKGQISHVKITGDKAKLYQKNDLKAPSLDKVEQTLKSLRLSAELIEFNLLNQALTTYRNINLEIISLNSNNSKDDRFDVKGEFLELLQTPKNTIRITGKPLTLTITQNGTTLNAQAKNMQYDIQTQQLELENNVYFASALGEMEAPKILYNVRSSTLSAPKIPNKTIKMTKTKTLSEKNTKEPNE